MIQVPYITSNTNLAAFLVLQGFHLHTIQYEPQTNGKQRGFYIFEPSDELTDAAHLFESGQASVNLADFEKTKTSLLDRVMQGRP